MVCNKCGQSSCIKKGVRNGRQRYYCKSCRCNFQSGYSYKAYLPHVSTLIKSLLKEGCGVRSIARVVGVSVKTVLARMIKISSKIKRPLFNMRGSSYQVDEMWSFIGNKKNVTWVTYAIAKDTGQVIDFFVGKKSKETIRPLINNVLLLQPLRVYTDGLNIYPGLIPKEIHRCFKYGTNTIERMNLTLRTHIKRL